MASYTNRTETDTENIKYHSKKLINFVTRASKKILPNILTIVSSKQGYIEIQTRVNFIGNTITALYKLYYVTII